MLNNEYNIQALIIMLSLIAEADDHVVWMRTPNYDQQLYVSPSFVEVWGRPCEVLYQDPLIWNTFLLDDERTQKIFELCARNPAMAAANRNTVYYRILRPDNSIRHLRDTCLFLKNKDEVVLLVGIAKSLSVIAWENEVKNLEQESVVTNNQLDLLSHIFMLASEKKYQDISSLKKTSLPEHYVFLRDGQHTALSQQEYRCLKFYLNGLSAKETAKKLGISNRTVETYIEIIKNKLSCHKKSEFFKNIHPCSLDIMYKV